MFHKELSELWNLKPDPETKELHTFWKGGMAGGIYIKRTFKYRNHDVLLAREEKQEWNKKEGVFLREIRELRGSEQVITERKKVSVPEWEQKGL